MIAAYRSAASGSSPAPPECAPEPDRHAEIDKPRLQQRYPGQVPRIDLAAIVAGMCAFVKFELLAAS
jgi:hypothetical protein